MSLDRHYHKGLQLISHCPLCQSHYPPRETTGLDARDDAHLIYLHCNTCGSSIVALVALDERGVFSQGLLTDLSREEVMRFHKGAEVNPDDVIEMHKVLTN